MNCEKVNFSERIIMYSKKGIFIHNYTLAYQIEYRIIHC